MMEERTTLKELPSGKIELVWNGVYSTLQFNVHCLDALPFCKAMCCRMRQGFSVMLKPEEIGKYKSRPHPLNPETHIVQTDSSGQHCTYLDSGSCQCTIHDHSPWMCGAYHCSPGGKGDRVEHRDGGWLWTPIGALQQLADGSVIDIRKIAKVNLPKVESCNK